MVGADVPHPDVIAHDEKDVGFLVLRLAGGDRAHQRDHGESVTEWFMFHSSFLVVLF
jgi:hypothetical protein